MRFTALDSFRGIAALLVAAYHFEATTHLYDALFFDNAYLFVDFFFVLSGFVIAHAYGDRITSRETFAAFVVRRFGRLWPLNATMLGAFVAVELAKLVLVKTTGITSGAAPFDPNGYTPLASIPGHLLFTTGIGLHDTITWNGPDWSISAEFWTYILFAVIAVTMGAWRFVGCAVAAVAALAILAANSKHGIDVTYELGFMRCVYGFMVGQLVYLLRQRTAHHAIRHPAAIEIVVLLVAVAYVTAVTRGANSYLAPIVFALVVYVFSFEQGPVSRNLNRPWPRYLGDLSYSIYMVHAFVWFVMGMIVSVVLRRYGLDLWQITYDEGISRRTLVSDHRTALDALFVVYLALVIGLAGLTKRYVEDPGRRLFGRLAARIEGAPRHSVGHGAVIPS